jgi:hypothetical protein
MVIVPFLLELLLGLFDRVISTTKLFGAAGTTE